MNNKVLLTGSMGYVGGRVALALREEGYSVYCGTRRFGLPIPPWFPHMKIVFLDWDSIESLTDVCKGMDSVIHLAAANEHESSSDPIAALKMNGLASLRLLEAAKIADVRRFIYFSTAHVYGSPLQGSIDETTLPRSVHPYAITHRVAEDFVLAAHEAEHIEGIVIRLSNSFGAPVATEVDRWTLLVNDLCRQAVTNGKLQLKSSGTQLRDFITLGDVTRAVNHLLKLDINKIDDGLFNLGGKTMSILEMTERVSLRWQLLTGHKIDIDRPVQCNPKVSELNYLCNKLASTGFKLTSDIDREIDDTLLLCLQAFGKQ